jgi:hypothetical protein
MSYRENYRLIEWQPLPERPRKRSAPAARSALPAPMVIGDAMPPVQSMLDGRMYESKSALRRTYREAGVTEVGNDVPMSPPPRPKADRKAVEASVSRALSKAGFGAP